MTSPETRAATTVVPIPVYSSRLSAARKTFLFASLIAVLIRLPS